MAKHLLVALLLLVLNLFQASQCAVAQERGRKIAHKQSKEFSCTGDDGSYPSPGECTDVYYVCSGGMASTQVCSAGNIFDPVTFVCTPFDQASCNQKFNCPVDGVFPYPDACTNLYYICSTGQSFIEYCPPEFVFDPISLRCETKETASCTPEITTLPPNESTTEVIITTDYFVTSDAPFTTEEPIATTEEPIVTTEEPVFTTEEPERTTFAAI
uniref:Chitin-binding type-2 domain-containing protein n=1 Tax=Daphnia galeata TaxID=27404 RepID=A0A8J2RWZ4_9CRUS|nr:unnamed protein product [Daphnia galeata]